MATNQPKKKPPSGRQLDFLERRPGGIEGSALPTHVSMLPGGGRGLGPDLDQATLDGARWARRMSELSRQSLGAWPRAILHADMDCFFVSVERLLDPSLEGRPVIVGGKPQSRGVVCSASYEAREKGVHSAMPCAQAHRLCPEAVFVPPSGPYREYSHKVRAIFERFTPRIQMISVDEGYLDITGAQRDGDPATAPASVATEIQRVVREELRLPISLGAATTKLVAKVASDQAKPVGVLAVYPGREAAFLGPLPLKTIPGIGRKTRESLEPLGIKTVGELRGLGRERLRALFGPEHGSRLFYRLMGFDAGVVESRGRAKSCGRERTFAEDIARHDTLEAILVDLAKRIAADLRKINARARTLTLKFRTPDFKTITRNAPLEPATRDEIDLVRAARAMLHRHHRPGDPLRLIGLSASNLRYEYWQPDLWKCETAAAERGAALAAEEEPGYGQPGYAEPAIEGISEDAREPILRPGSSDSGELLDAIDHVRERHGFKAIRRGGSLNAPMRKSKSPRD